MLDRHGLLGALALVAATLWVTRPAIDADFLAEDFGSVQLFHTRPLTALLKLGDVSQGIWGHPDDELRPVTALAFKACSLLFGPDPRRFHLVSLALHAAGALLLASIAGVLSGRSGVALLAGLLFALAPSHSEGIFWISGLVEPLSTAFYLASVLGFVLFRRSGSRRAYALSLLALAFGILAKETLVTLPLLLVTFDVWSWATGTGREAGPWPKRLKVHAPYFLVLAGFVALRFAAFGTLAREQSIGAPRLAAFLASQPERLRGLVLPLDGRLALVATLLLLALLPRDPRHRQTLALLLLFGPLWYGITLVPLVATYLAPRHLYLPSCGPSVAAALLLFPGPFERRSRLDLARLAAAAALVLAFAVTLGERAQAWAEAGAVSRKARADAERLARDILPGSVVVVSGVPPYEGEAWIWQWALPFALERPFVGEDLYSRFRVVETPVTYCCPLEAWWRAKRPILDALVAGPPEETVELESLHWNPRKGAFFRQRARLPRATVRAILERALGQPWGASGSIDDHRARRLVALLAGVVRAAGEER